jgi:hypothetical protein
VVISTVPSITVVNIAARVCLSLIPSAIANTTSRNDAVPKVMHFPKQAQPDTTQVPRLDQTPRGREATRRKAHLCILSNP